MSFVQVSRPRDGRAVAGEGQQGAPCSSAPDTGAHVCAHAPLPSPGLSGTVVGGCAG